MSLPAGALNCHCCCTPSSLFLERQSSLSAPYAALDSLRCPVVASPCDHLATPTPSQKSLQLPRLVFFASQRCDFLPSIPPSAYSLHLNRGSVLHGFSLQSLCVALVHGILHAFVHACRHERAYPPPHVSTVGHHDDSLRFLSLPLLAAPSLGHQLDGHAIQKCHGCPTTMVECGRPWPLVLRQESRELRILQAQRPRRTKRIILHIDRGPITPLFMAINLHHQLDALLC